MAVLKKKTRKAIKKSFRKALNKHGPRVARHLATGLATALATYVGAEGKKGSKKLAKLAESGGRKLGKTVSGAVPALEGVVTKIAGENGHKKARRRSRSKKQSSNREQPESA